MDTFILRLWVGPFLGDIYLILTTPVFVQKIHFNHEFD